MAKPLRMMALDFIDNTATSCPSVQILVRYFTCQNILRILLRHLNIVEHQPSNFLMSLCAARQHSEPYKSTDLTLMIIESDLGTYGDSTVLYCTV